MSADNLMAVIQESNTYIGYHCSASILCECPGYRECYSCTGTKEFKVESLDEAIQKCEEFGYLEYGYSFVDRHTTPELDKEFCSICPHNPKLPEEASKEARALGCNCEKIFFGGSAYASKLGKDCPVHSNIEWQKRMHFR